MRVDKKGLKRRNSKVLAASYDFGVVFVVVVKTWSDRTLLCSPIHHLCREQIKLRSFFSMLDAGQTHRIISEKVFLGPETMVSRF